MKHTTAYELKHVVAAQTELPAPDRVELNCGKARLDIGAVSGMISGAGWVATKGNFSFAKDVAPVIQSRGGAIGFWARPVFVAKPSDEQVYYRRVFRDPDGLRISGFAIPLADQNQRNFDQTLFGATQWIYLLVRGKIGVPAPGAMKYTLVWRDLWQPFEVFGDQSPCV